MSRAYTPRTCVFVFAKTKRKKTGTMMPNKRAYRGRETLVDKARVHCIRSSKKVPGKRPRGSLANSKPLNNLNGEAPGRSSFPECSADPHRRPQPKARPPTGARAPPSWLHGHSARGSSLARARRRRLAEQRWATSSNKLLSSFFGRLWRGLRGPTPR